MGSRHLGELLLRPSSLRNFSISHASTPFRPRIATTCLSQRHVSDAASSRPAQPQSTSDSKPEASSSLPSSENSATQAIDDLFAHSTPRPRSQNADTSQAIDSIFRNVQPSPQAQASRRQPSSADEYGSARRVFGANFSKPNSNLGRQRLNFDDMNMPDSALSPQPQTVQVPTMPEKEIKYPRLNATTGRTIELDPSKGRDIVRGLSMLGSLMSRNRVRADFQKQRYHERAGLKRKRLKSERWRARFKVGFYEVTRRVTELTRKGW